MKNSNKPLVLVVDDDPKTLFIIDRILKSGGYDVVTSDSGSDAISVAVEKKPDLILLDIMMHEMDGYEVAAKLQLYQETSDIPLIFLTAYGGKQSRTWAVALGVVDYLVKPLDKDLILNKINKYLQTYPSRKTG